MCLDGETTTGMQVGMWAGGEPNGLADENCVAGHASGLYDSRCGVTHKLICQRPVRAL